MPYELTLENRPCQRTQTDSVSGWDWERITDKWMQRIQDFGLTLDTVFKDVHVHDPESPQAEPRPCLGGPEPGFANSTCMFRGISIGPRALMGQYTHTRATAADKNSHWNISGKRRTRPALYAPSL